MDTMAAFALGTEPPLQSVVAGEPYKNMQVLQPQIWRQILGMSLWNFIVIMCVIFFAPMTVEGMHWKMTDSPKRAVSVSADGAARKKDAGGNATAVLSGDEWKLLHMTYIFNIFVFLQLFN